MRNNLNGNNNNNNNINNENIENNDINNINNINTVNDNSENLCDQNIGGETPGVTTLRSLTNLTQGPQKILVTLDDSGQPLDKSGVNSWSKRLSEVNKYLNSCVRP